MPCDSLLGRIYREREKQSLTAFPLGRVRSLATSPQAKERGVCSSKIKSFEFFSIGASIF